MEIRIKVDIETNWTCNECWIRVAGRRNQTNGLSISISRFLRPNPNGSRVDLTGEKTDGGINKSSHKIVRPTHTGNGTRFELRADIDQPHLQEKMPLS